MSETYTDYDAPEGLRIRGTVIVVPGRGETRATYRRFGSRIAADAYRVRVIDPVAVDVADVAGSLTLLGERLAAALEGAATGDGVARPVVLVGADSGAAAIAALVAGGDSTAAWWPEAVVLGALPAHRAATSGSWDDELDARTFCPAHRGVLNEDTALERGSLAQPLPDALLDAAYASTAGVPQLLLVGDSDPLADRDGLAQAAKSLPRSRLSVVRGAHHDVLNDLQHRPVAAEVVTFLEAVRNELVPIVAVESSAW